jgi:hypothetical protein
VPAPASSGQRCHEPGSLPLEPGHRWALWGTWGRLASRLRHNNVVQREG